MTGSIIFSSADEYRVRRSDTAFWRPWLKEIFRRHDLKDGDPVSGIGGTYPTFICGELVVKLFGFNSSWRVSLAAERAAHEKLAAYREIAAPLLWRQAQGLAQHPLGMDVFHKLPTVLPVEQIATLDELAQALFAV